MEFTLKVSKLLNALQNVVGVVEKKSTMPILNNVYVHVSNKRLELVTTNLEVELFTEVALDEDTKIDVEFTVDARKLLDICKTVSPDEFLNFKITNQRVVISTSFSSFKLCLLSVENYPFIRQEIREASVSLPQKVLLGLLKSTYFSMAQQDIRIFLNGMLFDIDNNNVTLVSSDGHRFSLSSFKLTSSTQSRNILLPRRSVLELLRLLESDDSEITIRFSKRYIKIELPHYTLTSKLLEANYPAYKNIVPQNKNKLEIGREELKQALQSVAILSNHKYSGVNFDIANGMLTLTSNNQEQEQAEYKVRVNYHGPEVKITLNFNYILDILNALAPDKVEIYLKNNKSSILIKGKDDKNSLYIVMPIRV